MSLHVRADPTVILPLEEKKKKMRLERRLAREKSVEESIPLWEKQILSDWKNASRSPGFKRLWWNGIPAKLRGVIWEKVVGNGLALSKGLFYIFYMAFN